jgi:hypothetical protein
MKSDHRHELKTNELADWMAHFPQWFKENTKTIVGVSAVVAVVVAVYGWNKYSTNVLAVGNRAAFTKEVAQLGGIKGQVYQEAMGGKDMSFLLGQSAESLGTLAREENDRYMAAMALIKQAEALRAELHYQTETMAETSLADQIEQAKASYTQAVEKATGNSSLTSVAQYGLGLCDEELGNLDQAKKIYQGIVADEALDGTVGRAAAQHRLAGLNQYVRAIAFKMAPEPVAPEDVAPGDILPTIDSTLMPIPAVDTNASPVVPVIGPAPVAPDANTSTE